MKETHSNFAVKLTVLKVKTLRYFFSENRVILISVVLSQYTRVIDWRQTTDRQTTYHDNSRTLQWNCNVRLKTHAYYRIVLSNRTGCILSHARIDRGMRHVRTPAMPKRSALLSTWLSHQYTSISIRAIITINSWTLVYYCCGCWSTNERL